MGQPRMQAPHQLRPFESPSAPHLSGCVRHSGTVMPRCSQVAYCPAT